MRKQRDRKVAFCHVSIESDQYQFMWKYLIFYCGDKKNTLLLLKTVLLLMKMKWKSNCCCLLTMILRWQNGRCESDGWVCVPLFPPPCNKHKSFFSIWNFFLSPWIHVMYGSKHKQTNQQITIIFEPKCSTFFFWRISFLLLFKFFSFFVARDGS